MATHEEDALLYRKTLRAVGELHKPEQGWCGCASGDPYLDSKYPCPTIQAIEKELS